MPVKRRVSKRSDTISYEIWSGIFNSGYDFFDELKDIGIGSQPPGTPYDADALAAWEQYGVRWLEQHLDRKTSWAEKRFGRPWENRDAG